MSYWPGFKSKWSVGHADIIISYCAQKIRPSNPHSQFHALQWRFTWHWQKQWPELWEQGWGCCIMTMSPVILPCSPGYFWPQITWLLFLMPPTCLIWHSATSLNSEIVTSRIRLENDNICLGLCPCAKGERLQDDGGLYS